MSSNHEDSEKNLTEKSIKYNSTKNISSTISNKNEELTSPYITLDKETLNVKRSVKSQLTLPQFEKPSFVCSTDTTGGDPNFNAVFNEHLDTCCFRSESSIHDRADTKDFISELRVEIMKEEKEQQDHPTIRNKQLKNSSDEILETLKTKTFGKLDFFKELHKRNSIETEENNESIDERGDSRPKRIFNSSTLKSISKTTSVTMQSISTSVSASNTESRVLKTRESISNSNSNNLNNNLVSTPSINNFPQIQNQYLSPQLQPNKNRNFNKITMNMNTMNNMQQITTQNNDKEHMMTIQAKMNEFDSTILMKKKFNPLQNFRPTKPKISQDSINTPQLSHNIPKDIADGKRFSGISSITSKPNSDKLIQVVPNILDKAEDEIVKLFDRIVDEGGLKISNEIYFQFKGKFSTIATTQIGSRKLQKSMDGTSTSVLNLIAEELIEDVNRIILDKYANYFCQKLYSHVTVDIKSKFLRKVDFYKVGIDETGTYPLQYILESMMTQEEKEIAMSKVLSMFLELSVDKFGSHIVEKTLSRCDYSYLKSNCQSLILDNLMKLACDPNGIKVLKFYAQSVFQNNDHALLEEKIFDNLGSLINSQFGNYLIQCIIENWSIDYSWKIVDTFKKKLLQLVTQKYSSNVIEKLINIAGEKFAVYLQEDILMPNKLQEISKSHFSLFVIRKMVSLLPLDRVIKVHGELAKYLPKIKHQKTFERWSSFLEEVEKDYILKQNKKMELKGRKKSDNSIVNNPSKLAVFSERINSNYSEKDQFRNIDGENFTTSSHTVSNNMNAFSCINDNLGKNINIYKDKELCSPVKSNKINIKGFLSPDHKDYDRNAFKNHFEEYLRKLDRENFIISSKRNSGMSEVSNKKTSEKLLFSVKDRRKDAQSPQSQLSLQSQNSKQFNFNQGNMNVLNQPQVQPVFHKGFYNVSNVMNTNQVFPVQSGLYTSTGNSNNQSSQVNNMNNYFTQNYYVNNLGSPNSFNSNQLTQNQHLTSPISYNNNPNVQLGNSKSFNSFVNENSINTPFTGNSNFVLQNSFNIPNQGRSFPYQFQDVPSNFNTSNINNPHEITHESSIPNSNNYFYSNSTNQAPLVNNFNNSNMFGSQNVFHQHGNPLINPNYNNNVLVGNVQQSNISLNTKGIKSNTPNTDYCNYNMQGINNNQYYQGEHVNSIPYFQDNYTNLNLPNSQLNQNSK